MTVFARDSVLSGTVQLMPLASSSSSAEPHIVATVLQKCTHQHETCRFNVISVRNSYQLPGALVRCTDYAFSVRLAHSSQANHWGVSLPQELNAKRYRWQMPNVKCTEHRMPPTVARINYGHCAYEILRIIDSTVCLLLVLLLWQNFETQSALVVFWT